MNANEIEYGMRVRVGDDPTMYEVESVGLYFEDMVTCKMPGDRLALYTFLAENLVAVESEAIDD